MKKGTPIFALATLVVVASACQKQAGNQEAAGDSLTVIEPVIITDTVRYDTDDPAIWINPEDASKSLIIGTDKDEDGALYVFDLEGKIQEDKVIRNLKRPNNVDIAYGLVLGGKKTDIAVVTERKADKIRIYSLPDMKPVDNGGIDVFAGDSLRAPMGIALYTRPNGEIFAIVSRKTGPSEGYLWQYRLQDDGTGNVKGTVVRKFGKYSGKKEIESIAVDNELGYVYYSDEQVGTRKYLADPDSSAREITLIPNDGFTEDNEGISIYKTGKDTGYILVSDQGAGKFHIYDRKADANGKHTLVKIVKVAALKSDGSDVTSLPLNKTFSKGLFVTMSEGKVFHYYRWEDILKL